MEKEKGSKLSSLFKKKSRKEKKLADQTLHKTDSKKPKKIKKTKKKERVNLLSNLSIGAKYLATFSVSVVFFVVAIVLVFIQLNNADSNVEDIIKKNQLTNDMAQLALLVEQQNALISDYIIVGNNKSVTNFEEVTEELKSVFERLEVHFENDEENLYVFNRVKDMNAKIEDIFLEKIAGQSNSGEVIYAQIQIGSQKTASVTSINRLIDSVNEQQNSSVTKVENSMEKSMFILVIASVISIVSGFIIMVLISRMISKNMKNVVSVTDELSKGNLAVEPIAYKGKDEIGQLALAVNSLRENMNGVIKEVINAAKSLDISSDVMTKSAREVKEGSEQMVTTMEELASGSESQANSASDLSEKMQQFLESVQTSQQEGQDIASSSKEMLTLTSDGAGLMKQSVSQMNRIDNIVSNAVNQVRGLDEQSGQISKLVEVVKNIADQTNLLALNAAIEAARAGEHGRGFAVVADEVRKLAEQVTSSVSEITQIVTNIQTETDDVVDSLGKGYEEVKEGIQQIEKTGHSFDTIDGAISGVVDNISEVANRLKEIAENSEQMNTLIGDIAAVSEEAAAGIEQSSASTQEASSSMDEISNNAQELAGLSNKLNKEVSIFTLK